MAILDAHNLAKLHPAFRLRAQALGGLLTHLELSVRWLYGYRDVELQAKFYEKYKAGGPKANKPGLSWHQYGLALDGVPFYDKDRDAKLDANELTWDRTDPVWEKYGILAESLGLIWGGRWGDGPHIEWHPGFSSRIRVSQIPTLLHIKTTPGHFGPFSTAPGGKE